jgi:hypothetical protein
MAALMQRAISLTTSTTTTIITKFSQPNIYPK